MTLFMLYASGLNAIITCLLLDFCQNKFSSSTGVEVKVVGTQSGLIIQAIFIKSQITHVLL